MMPFENGLFASFSLFAGISRATPPLEPLQIERPAPDRRDRGP
jgi:hypothetical protein